MGIKAVFKHVNWKGRFNREEQTVPKTRVNNNNNNIKNKLNHTFTSGHTVIGQWIGEG